MTELYKASRDGCYSDDAWIDYARGIVSPDAAAAMRKHLETGCTHCLARLAVWAEAVRAASADMRFSPPEAVVNSVKNAFQVKQRLPFFESLAETARLVMDSFRGPLPAGIRGAVAAPSRHVVHGAGSVLIDVQIDSNERGVTCLTGQLSYRDGVPGVVAGTEVYLTRGKADLVGLAITNGFGEFTLDVDNGADLDIYCRLPSGDLISVSLPKLEV
jgi:hypothetical protein